MLGSAYDRMKEALDKVNSIQTELKIIQRNREELHRISRMLPEIEAYKLMALYDDSMKNLHEAWSKLK